MNKQFDQDFWDGTISPYKSYHHWYHFLAITSAIHYSWYGTIFHETFQVPKMEVLTYISSI